MKDRRPVGRGPGDLYWLEHYLFSQVARDFAQTGTLSAFDFFCIVIWKANRAKSKVARRLLDAGFPDLPSAVSALARDIGSASQPKERLRVLVQKWRFRLPMASAILTVLYPDEFTIYDVRVCQSLKDSESDFASVQNRVDFDSLWEGYSGFLSRVQEVAPQSLALRDKDRWLWGKSFGEQLATDIEACFGIRKPAVANDA